MGLPVERLTIATNANDILARALASGRYEVRGVVATTSPSMDIQVSSNFERALFEANGRDAGAIRAMMAALKQAGQFDLGAALPELRSVFAAAAASEAEVAAGVRNVAAQSAYSLDPHTACAVVALDKLGRSAAPEVVLATAHPAKFPDAMAAITGKRPALPQRLAGLMTAPERIVRLANAAGTIEHYVAAHSRVVAGAAA
jgi:threonine synthase